MTTLLSNKSVRSRKVHQCVICGLSIPRNHLYQRQSLVDQDGFQSSAIHICCYEWARKTWSYNDWEESATWPEDEIRADMPLELQQQINKLHELAIKQNHDQQR
jgi:hypothetical protein